MKIKKDLELAWNILVHSKLRSWLTIIGIIIGIGSVVAIVSISQGAEKQMEENMKSFNRDQITITAGYSRAQSMFGGGGPEGIGRDSVSSTSSSDEDEPELTNKDVLAIKSVDNIKKVMVKISGTEEVIYASKKSDVQITAISPEDFSDWIDGEIIE